MPSPDIIIEDRKKLTDRLNTFIVSALYQDINPVNYWECTATGIERRKEEATEMYNHNALFHAKVNFWVDNIMSIIG